MIILAHLRKATGWIARSFAFWRLGLDLWMQKGKSPFGTGQMVTGRFTLRPRDGCVGPLTRRPDVNRVALKIVSPLLLRVSFV